MPLMASPSLCISEGGGVASGGGASGGRRRGSEGKMEWHEEGRGFRREGGSGGKGRVSGMNRTLVDKMFAESKLI